MKTKDSIWVYVIGFPIALLLSGLIMMWENYLLFQYPLEFWKLIFLNLVIVAAAYVTKLKVGDATFSPISFVCSLVFGAAIIVQGLYWVGIVKTLPIFPL